MKTFIFSTALFLIIICLTVINSVYISKTTEKFANILNEFPAEVSADLIPLSKKLKSYYAQNKFFIMLSNHHSKVNEIDRLLQLMEAGIRSEDQSMYEEARVSLYEANSRLLEFNKISLSGIL